MALLETLTNNFGTNITGFTDASSGGSATISGSKLVLNCGTAGGHFAAIVTTVSYDFLTSFAYARVTIPSHTGLDFFFFLRDTSDDFNYSFNINSSSNIVYARTGATLSSEAYSATDHKWLKFRESAGGIFLEAAPDSGSGPGTFVGQDSDDYGANAPTWDPEDIFAVFYLPYSGTSNVTAEIQGFNTNVAGGGAASITAILSAYGEY
jgi:hypothetical protein